MKVGSQRVLRNQTPGAISLTAVSVGTNQPEENPPTAARMENVRLATNRRILVCRIIVLTGKGPCSSSRTVQPRANDEARVRAVERRRRWPRVKRMRRAWEPFFTSRREFVNLPGKGQRRDNEAIVGKPVETALRNDPQEPAERNQPHEERRRRTENEDQWTVTSQHVGDFEGGWSACRRQN